MKINTTARETTYRLSKLNGAEYDRQRLDGLSDLLAADIELLQKSGHAAPEGKFAAARDMVADTFDTLSAADADKRQRHEATVAAMAESIAAGQPPKVPKTQPDPDTTALYKALEKNLLAAHEADVDAHREHWVEWRRDDVVCAERAHRDLDAALAAALDAARVLVARRAAVLALDSDTLARDKALDAEVCGERRPGAVAWFYETHFPSGGFQPVVQAIDDLAKRVAVSHEFPAADWLPPSDPGHDELLATDVDASRRWLHRMAQRETTATCSVCNLAPAEVPILIEGKWWTVCKACAAATAAEQDKILDKREREARAAEHGVDPNAFYSVGEDGSHHPAR